MRPRRVHRHASGAAQGKVGALPALNHKPELSAGRYRPDAIRLYEHRFIVRAHHKLKWARKVQSVLGVLYELLPRSESNKAISTANSIARQILAAHPNSARSTLSDRGWQQPLNCHKAQPARRVKDAEGTAQPLVLDSVRWLGYLLAFPARIFRNQALKASISCSHLGTPQPIICTINSHLRRHII